MMQIILYVAIGCMTSCVLVLLAVPFLLRPTAETKRIIDVVKSSRPDRRPLGRKEKMEEGLLSIAHEFRMRLGITVSAKSRERLLSAGFRNPASIDAFFAAQLITPLAGAFVGSFMPDNTLFWAFAFAAVGYVAPNFWITEKIRQRKEKIRRSLPDAIDLLVICVDAGLGLDQAILRVSSELNLSHPEIHEEFTRLHQEQRAGRPRLETWQNLATRTNIAELASFASMLTQTDRFGTPIIKALSSFSDDLRLKRRQRAEEAAAKTKVKIIFPLVFCVFPCLFIVLLAPAVLSITNTLAGK